MLKISKAQQLREHLAQRIETMEEGERFLSVRNIMKEYGVSQSVVGQSLSLLESGGLLYREHGKGLFVRETSIEKLKICFLVPHWPSLSITEVHEDLLAEAQQQGYRLQMRTYPHAQEIWKHLPGQEFDGLIFVSNADFVSVDCLSHLINSPIPVVIRGASLKEIHISSVSSHNMVGGAMAASYLIRKGHRSLALALTCPMTSSALRERADGFLLMARSNDIPVTTIDCKVRSGEHISEKTSASMKKWLAQNDVDFTAVHTLDDEGALAAMHAFKEHGLSIPGDVSVIGYGGLRRSAFFDPPLTSIVTNPQTISRETFNALKTMIQDRSQVVKKLIMPEVVERQSVLDRSVSLANR